jgi:UDP-N-acetylmuramate dehydrogenase
VPDPLVEQLRVACVGTVAAEAPLAPMTTLRVGGAARVLVTAESDADLTAVAVASDAHGVPVLVLGRGSNMLVADTGWSGIALILGRGFRGIDVTASPDGGATVRVGAGEPLPAVAVMTGAEGLGGFAWGVGVPGTVGGAVRMNAGAHQGEMADVLVEVDLFRRSSRTRESWPVALLGLGYRSSSMPSDALVVSATLQLPPAAAGEVKAELAEVRRWRQEHQPLEHPNCGSVWRNPVGDAAGRLIDAAGLRGHRVGGAMVSPKHANFVTTEPGGTAADVLAVMEHVHATVLGAYGVDLVSELVVVGR